MFKTNQYQPINVSSQQNSSVIQLIPVTVIYVIIIILTITGNMLFILSALLVKRLRTPNNILIVNMAICDIMVAVIVMPIAALNHLLGEYWQLGSFLCDFWTTMDVFLCSSSIFNFLLISMDRYLIIKNPFAYERIMNFRIMLCGCTVSWCISAFVSFAPAIGWEMASSNLPVCIVNQSLSYQILATLLTFYIPLALVLTTYAHIYRIASSVLLRFGNLTFADSSTINKNQNIKRMPFSETGTKSNATGQNNVENKNTLLPSSSSPGYNDKQLRKYSKVSILSYINLKRLSCMNILKSDRNQNCKSALGANQKAIRTLGIILGCFCLCWIPFFSLALFKPIYLKYTGKKANLPYWLDPLFLWLGYLNSTLNPIIYSIYHKEFRYTFKYLLTCKCRGINMYIQKDIYETQFQV
ncbi:hypothetical protein GJ496_010146 [Pomphorhynchus laevis]|nr:hypothetical protein GJ496_010146 [Pomphorhynchus laevis]